MTTFVTGGTSSIGRVLIQELVRQGEALRVLVRPNSNRNGLELPGVEFIRGDIADKVAVRKGMTGCDRVCHLAAIVGHPVSDQEQWRVNQEGTRTVLQVAHDFQVESFVQVSSITVLGPTRPGEVADETRPVETRKYFNLYQQTKRAADDLARRYGDKGLPVKIVYPGFGYGCSWSNSHPTLTEETLLRLAAGKSVSLLGSGRNQIALAYYRDTAQGIRLTHERGKAGEEYILAGDTLTWPEIWRVIAQILDKEPPHRRVPMWLLRLASGMNYMLKGKPLYPPEYYEMFGYNWNFSCDKAKQELGWRPHSFHVGMAKAWAEYQSHGQRREHDRKYGRQSSRERNLSPQHNLSELRSYTGSIK